MRKISSIILLSTSLLVMGACDNTTEKEKIEASVENAEQNSQSTVNTTEKVKEDKKEYNQEIVNDEYLKVTLMSIDRIVDTTYNDEKIVVSFDVENKRDKLMAVQARQVSINDRMVDESLLSMSTEIAPKKSAIAKLNMQSYNDEPLPELTGNLELTLHIIDWDDYDFEHEVPVKISLK